MSLIKLLRVIGPVKLILLVLYLFLPIVELLDGTLGVEDIYVVVVLFLLLNDLIHQVLRTYRKIYSTSHNTGKLDVIRAYVVEGGLTPSSFLYTNQQGQILRRIYTRDKYQNSERLNSKVIDFTNVREHVLKNRMNFLFALICFLPWLFGVLEIAEKVQRQLFTLGMMFWSFALLTVTLREHKFKKIKIIYCGVAFCVMFFSLITF